MIVLRHPARPAPWSTSHDVTETGDYVHRILLAVIMSCGIFAAVLLAAEDGQSQLWPCHRDLLI